MPGSKAGAGRGSPKCAQESEETCFESCKITLCSEEMNEQEGRAGQQSWLRGLTQGRDDGASTRTVEKEQRGSVQRRQIYQPKSHYSSSVYYL